MFCYNSFMKKVIALVLILTFSAGLTSCKSDSGSKALISVVKKTAEHIPPVKKKVKYSASESSGTGRRFESGYTVEKTDKGYRFNIYMGQRNTGGYSINVTDVRMDEDKVLYISVETHSPDPASYVTQVITYPSCSITVKAKPLMAVVYDQNGNEFKRLGDHVFEMPKDYN